MNRYCNFLNLARWAGISALNRDAWKSVEGTSSDDAKAKYVEKLLEVRIKEPFVLFNIIIEFVACRS